MRKESLRGSWGRVAGALVALAGLWSASCGSHDFYTVFPNGTRLENASRAQVDRAFEFRLDRGEDGRLAPTGTVTVTFGDPGSTVEVPGRVRLTDVKSTTQPTARLEVTYQPAGDAATRCRELVRRAKAGAAPGDPALLLPDELPATQWFDVSNQPSRPGRLTLTDGYGTTLELATGQR